MRAFLPMSIASLLSIPILLHAALPVQMGAREQPARELRRIIRGPYLQLGTPNTITIRWRTDKPTSSLVRYGPALDRLIHAVNADGINRDHVIELSGLVPGTRYFYTIGSLEGVFGGGDENHFFITAPPPGLQKPTRIWVLGDSGTQNKSARSVRDAYDKFSIQRRADLWLMLGDNAYTSGKDSEYQGALFEMYPRTLRSTVLWPALGNHDARSANSTNQTGPYYDIFTLPAFGQAGGAPSGTEAFYSFDYANIHFICLDSAASDLSESGPTIEWLKRDLAANSRTWTVAFLHHPPYTRGGHDSDNDSDSDGIMRQVRENIVPIIEQGGVDVVLSGHSHNYERSFLLDGFHGSIEAFTDAHKRSRGDGRVFGDGPYVKFGAPPAPHAGTVYVVAGSSGKTHKFPKFKHPAMVTGINTLGSLVIDVCGSRLDATFLDDKGNHRDDFTIIKKLEIP